MKCLCVILFASAVIFVSAQDAKDDADNLLSDYDAFYDYDSLKAEGDKLEAELDKLEEENDKKVKEDIDKFREDQDYEYKDDVLDGIDDYQFEDNRDKKEEKDVDDKEQRQKDAQADYALLWGDDSVAPLPVPDAESSNEDVLEETRNILKEDGDAFEDLIIKSLDDAKLSDDQPNDDIIEETKQILEDTDDQFNEQDVSINKPFKTEDEKVKYNDDEEAEEIENKNLIKDKTIDEIPAENDQGDLKELNNEDIIEETKNILENTGDSFSDDEVKTNDNIDESMKVDEEKVVSDNADEIADKKIIDEVPSGNVFEDAIHNVENFDELDTNEDAKADEKAFEAVDDVIPKEDTVDKVYADLHNDLDKLLDTLDKLSDDGDIDDDKLEQVYDKIDEQLFKDDANGEALADDNNDADYGDIDLDKILEDIFNEDDMKDNIADTSNDDIELKVKLNDEMNKPNPEDAFEKEVEPLPNANEEPILPYLDAIVDKPKDTESIETVNESKNDASIETPEKTDTDKLDTVDIDTLNSEQLEDLVDQFAMANAEILDTNSKSFEKDTAPIRIKLYVDEPVVITSPDYPSAYPTNNVIDWIFDGDGVGIEMNITDFLVNGALGDYLLVKPGGVDDSGHDSLLFTYRLNSEKRFIFSEVDRLFVRFQAQPAMWNILRGFRMSVKMLSALPEDPQPLQEPEAVLQPPHSTHTLHLAVAVPQFQALNDSFRLLLADMAEEYITDNDIEKGVNTTQEVTQITSVSVCPVNWPRFELCTAVTFGVSLVDGAEGMLDGEALEDMWETYSTRDPYALRLRKMGIAEFEKPSSSVMTAWLVIASVIVIAMMMMTFMFWRYSCFKDYTRMQTYSDTDSIQNEKRGLDLYPTPHQTLPPLYADSEYKWQDNEDTTRVDIGGFANKSYARDMYDFDSDEDVVPSRERNSGTVTARDIYSGSVA